MDDKHAQEMAMFRFGLIAPAINGTFTEPSRAAYYRVVAADVLTLPDGTLTSYSASTLGHWERLFRKGGFDALVHQSRSDKGYPRKLTQEAIDNIFALRSEYPRINATMIYEKLIEDSVIKENEVSLSTVQRFVRRRIGDMVLPGEHKDRKAFEAERVFELWQADTLYGPFVGSGKKKSRAYLITVIDDKSRLICASKFFPSDKAATFQKVFKDAVLRFGVPEKLYVDNGAPYKNEQLSAICGRLGVVLIHAPVRDGAAKGKVERLHRTIRERFLSTLNERNTLSFEALNDAYISWVNSYNTSTHSAHGKKPMNVYQESQNLVRQPKSAEWVQECFLNRISRKVKKDATLTIDNVCYDAPAGFIGMKVEILFLPDDMTTAHIVFESKTYPLRVTDRVQNSKTRRSTSPYLIDYSKGGN